MRSALCVFICVFGGGAVAQEDAGASGLQESLEMPGHRSLVSVVTDPDTALKPFETDGCSGGMSWGWRVVADIFPDFATAQGAAPPWENCCVVHDHAYHDAGGTSDATASFAARLTADEALRKCVIDEGAGRISELAVEYDVSEDQVRMAYDIIAETMFDAVRFGGGPCSGLPWRWGYGYPNCIPGF